MKGFIFDVKPFIPFLIFPSISCNSRAKCSRPYSVDLYFEGHPWLSASYGYRTAQGMPVIPLFDARHKFAAWYTQCKLWFQSPASIERAVPDSITRVNR